MLLSTVSSESRKRTSSRTALKYMLIVSKKMNAYGGVFRSLTLVFKTEALSNHTKRSVLKSNCWNSVYYLAEQFQLTHGTQNGLLYLEKGA